MFRMLNAEEVATPLATSTYLDKDEQGKEVSANLSKSMIGSLFYLITSRFDVLYSICMCPRFQSCTKESHLTMVKRILKYHAHTYKLRLR